MYCHLGHLRCHRDFTILKAYLSASLSYSSKRVSSTATAEKEPEGFLFHVLCSQCKIIEAVSCRRTSRLKSPWVAGMAAILMPAKYWQLYYSVQILPTFTDGGIFAQRPCSSSTCCTANGVIAKPAAWEHAVEVLLNSQ